MKIFVDTDMNFPSDDFQALLLLFASPGIEVIGCGAAAGNTWAEEVEVNLHRAAQLINEAKLSVWTGIPHSNWSQRHAEAISLKSAGVRSFVGAYEKSRVPRPWVRLNQARSPSASSAEALITLSHQHPGEIVVLCLGPLSNLARALEIDPTLAARLSRVVTMSGCFDDVGPPGHPSIDFNVWFDPRAAERVYNCGVPTLIVPLDICRTARLTADRLLEVARFDRGRAALFLDDFLGMVRQHGPAMPLLDQLAVLLLCSPALITRESPGHIEVDCDGDAARRGTTVLRPDPKAKASVVREIDADGVYEQLSLALATMCTQSVANLPAFSTPSYEYAIGERLETPLSLIATTYDGRYHSPAAINIESAGHFAAIAAPLLEVLVGAKQRGELWPPSPRADAIIAQTPIGTGVALDPLALKELEYLVSRRLLNARAIATIAKRGEPPKGLTCISELSEVRRIQMMGQFEVDISPRSILMEFSYVQRGTFGPLALEHMASSLLSWYCAGRIAEGPITVLAVSLATQDASRHKLRQGGYCQVGRHLIPDGPEKGRELFLYSSTINASDLARIRSLGPEFDSHHPAVM